MCHHRISATELPNRSFCEAFRCVPPGQTRRVVMACPLSAAAKAQRIPAARAAVATSRLLPEHVRSDQDKLVRALNPRSEQAIRRSVPRPHVQRVASTASRTGSRVVHGWMDGPVIVGFSLHSSHRALAGACWFRKTQWTRRIGVPSLSRRPDAQLIRLFKRTAIGDRNDQRDDKRDI